jgi:hypothetical protein
MAIVKDERILELALKGLEAERDRIVYEIAELRARLGGRVAKARRNRATRKVKKRVATAKKRTRKMTAAQRKAISDRMKAAWARRRAKKK